MRQLRLAAELEGFYRELFLPLVRRATWRHGLSKEDARDIVQDAFVLAVLKLRLGGNAAAWLTRAVDLLSINFRRKGARRARLEARWLNVEFSPKFKEDDFDSDPWSSSE